MNVQMLKQNAVGASLARSAFARKLKSISGEDFGVDCPNLLEDERRMYALPELEKVGEDAGGVGGGMEAREDHSRGGGGGGDGGGCDGGGGGGGGAAADGGGEEELRMGAPSPHPPLEPSPRHFMKGVYAMEPNAASVVPPSLRPNASTLSTPRPPETKYATDGSRAMSRKGVINPPGDGNGGYSSKGSGTNPTSKGGASASASSSSSGKREVGHVRPLSGKLNGTKSSSKTEGSKGGSKLNLVEAALSSSPESAQSPFRSAMDSPPSDKEGSSTKRGAKEVALKKLREANRGHGNRCDGHAGAAGAAGPADDESSGKCYRYRDSSRDSPRYGKRRDSSFSAPSEISVKGKGAHQSRNWTKGDGSRGLSRGSSYNDKSRRNIEIGGGSKERTSDRKSETRGDHRSDRSRSHCSSPPSGSRKVRGFLLRSPGLVDQSVRTGRKDVSRGSRWLLSDNNCGGGGSGGGGGGGDGAGGGGGQRQQCRGSGEYYDTRHGRGKRGNRSLDRHGGPASSSPLRKAGDWRHESRRRELERWENCDASSIPRKRDANGPDHRAQSVQPARGIGKDDGRSSRNSTLLDKGASRGNSSQGRKSPDRRRSRERGSRNCRSPDRKLLASSMGHGSHHPDAYRSHGHGNTPRAPLHNRDPSPPKRLTRGAPSPSLSAAVAAVTEAAAGASLSTPTPSTNGRPWLASGVGFMRATPPSGDFAHAGHLPGATDTGGSPITAGKDGRSPAKPPRKGLEFGQGMAMGFKKPKPIMAEKASKPAASKEGENRCELPELFVDMVELPRPGVARSSGTCRSQSAATAAVAASVGIASKAKRKRLKAAVDEALLVRVAKRNRCERRGGDATWAGGVDAGATRKGKKSATEAGGGKKTNLAATSSRSGGKSLGKSRPRLKVKPYGDNETDATTLSTGMDAAGKGVVRKNRNGLSLSSASDTPAKVEAGVKEGESGITNNVKVAAATAGTSAAVASTTSGDGNGQVPPEAADVDAMAEAAVGAITARIINSYMPGAVFAVAAGAATPPLSKPLVVLRRNSDGTRPSAVDAANVSLAAPTSSISSPLAAVAAEGLSARLAVGVNTVTGASRDSTPSPRSPADMNLLHKNGNKASDSVITDSGGISGRADRSDCGRTSDSYDRERRSTHTPSADGLRRRDSQEHNGREESRAACRNEPRDPCETQQHGDGNRRSIDRASRERFRRRARDPVRSKSPPSRHRSRTSSRERSNYRSRSRCREDRCHRQAYRSRSGDRGDQKCRVDGNKGRGGRDSYREQGRDERPYGRQWEEGHHLIRSKGSRGGRGRGGGAGGREGQGGGDGEGLGDLRRQGKGRSHTPRMSADKRVQKRARQAAG